MATFTKFQGFVEHLAEGAHNLGSDALTIALSNVLPDVALTTANTVLASITEISYTNVVTTPTGSRVIGVTTSAQTTGTYKLVLPDMTITATGGAIATFRYVVIYNDTPSSPANPLVGFYDYGVGGVTLLVGESLLINFDDSNGVLTLA